MVPEITRQWFHAITYSRENKYKGKYLIKERPSKYTRQQQRCWKKNYGQEEW